MRLPLRFAVPLLLAAVFGALQVISVRRELSHHYVRADLEARERARIVGEVVADELESAFRHGASESARAAMAGAASDRSLERTAFAAPSGHVLYGRPFDLAGRTLEDPSLAPFAPLAARVREHRVPEQSLSEDGAFLWSALPVRLRARPDELVPSEVGVLLMEHDLRPGRAAARADALAAVPWIALGLVGCAVALWLVLSRVLIARLDRLGRTADAVAAGNLDARSGITGRDEIAALAHRLDEMAAAVSARDHALRESEARLHALLENAHDIIVVVGPDRRLGFVSPSVRRLLGWAPEDLVGKLVDEHIHPGDLGAVSREIARVLREPDYVGRAEFRFRHADGGYRQLEAVGVVARAEDGIRGLVVNTRDVTERRNLEARLAQAERLETVGRLAGGVAHDFNNLLTAILGNAELALASSGEDDWRDAVRQVQEAGRSAERLTRQLLAFGRSQPLRPEVVDVDDVVARMARLMERVIGETIRLDVRPCRRGAAVFVDPVQIEQVLLNLVVNARDAMPRGGRVCICTDLRSAEPGVDLPPGEHVLLEVRDEGGGMDESVLPHVFEPFFTTKAEGSGMGLATVYGIVRQSGGDVTVESQPGRGTRVAVWLPRCQAAAAEAARDAETAALRPRTHRSVLVVEDQREVRRFVCEILERVGHRVVAAGDAGGALALAAEMERIDALVSDLRLPDLPGTEVARRIREQHPRVPVLFISGWAEPELVEAVERSGDARFLAKPFGTAALRGALDELLAGRP